MKDDRENKNNHDQDEPKAQQGDENVGGNTGRFKLIKEIDLLMQIPEVEKFFSQALQEVKQKYWTIINQFPNLKDGAKDRTASGLSKSKSYFFEANRVEEPGSESRHKWMLEKCKLRADESVVNSIFSNFLKKLDQYETSLADIRTEEVEIPLLAKSFQINFTKSANNRVVGFLKEIEKEEELNVTDQLVQDNDNLITVNNVPQLDPHEIHARVIEVLEKYPKLTRNIYVYLLIAEKVNSEYLE